MKQTLTDVSEVYEMGGEEETLQQAIFTTRKSSSRIYDWD